MVHKKRIQGYLLHKKRIQGSSDAGQRPLSITFIPPCESVATTLRIPPALAPPFGDPLPQHVGDSLPQRFPPRFSRHEGQRSSPPWNGAEPKQRGQPPSSQPRWSSSKNSSLHHLPPIRTCRSHFCLPSRRRCRETCTQSARTSCCGISDSFQAHQSAEPCPDWSPKHI